MGAPAMTSAAPAAPFALRGEHFAIELPGGRALFTTRRGGSSRGPYASLNLGRLTEDDPATVAANRDQLERETGLTLSYVHQVHGNAVLELSPQTAADSREAPLGELPLADGQLSRHRGIGALVLTADCLPVAVAGEGGVAMLHAGWKGLAAGVIAAGVRALRAAGVSGPLGAAIGPGAGACCYQVGDEVHAAFADRPPHVHRGDRVDLPAIARHDLETAGVAEVHDLDLCTICSDPSLFFSHRREHGVTGRQGGIAWCR